MALNVGRLQSLMELSAGIAGVTKDRIKPELLRELINLKLRNFMSRTSSAESKSTIVTVANQQEYELPDDKLHIKSVMVDDERAHKIIYDQVAEIAGTLS